MKNIAKKSAAPAHRKTSALAVPVFVVSCWFFSIVSALAVVYSTFQSRQATQELDDLRRQATGLQVMSGQLLLEKSSLAEYSRIERIALGQLEMKVPEVEKTVLVYRK